MTTTDELRRMLDERGVEYRTHGTTDRTWFEVGHISWFIFERENGNFTADAVFLTPEQAIAATLGTGTCRLVETEHEGKIIEGGYYTYWSYDCDECGHKNTEYGRFCAGCGRKVVDE